jgi:hypothetical protein
LFLKELFDLDNAAIMQAKKDRIDKQYYVDFQTLEKEALEKVMIAEEFNNMIRERIALMRLEDVKNYHAKARKMIG